MNYIAYAEVLVSSECINQYFKLKIFVLLNCRIFEGEKTPAIQEDNHILV